jgi:hypothetical protein
MKSIIINHDEPRPSWYKKIISYKFYPSFLYEPDLKKIEWYQKVQKEKGKKVLAYFKSGSYGNETIMDGCRYFYYNDKAKNKYSWIFNRVKIEAKSFVAKNNLIEKEKLHTIHFNTNFNLKAGESIVTTDIDDAYWEIAFKMGVIKERLFRKCLEIEDENVNIKELRNASLANLGSDKVYQVVEDMVYTGKKIVFKCDPKLKMLHNNITYTCCELMFNLSKMLGDDFKDYKTDEINYKRTKENVKMVNSYLKKHNLPFTNTYLKPEIKEPSGTNQKALPKKLGNKATKTQIYEK